MNVALNVAFERARVAFDIRPDRGGADVEGGQRRGGFIVAIFTLASFGDLAGDGVCGLEMGIVPVGPERV